MFWGSPWHRFPWGQVGSVPVMGPWLTVIDGECHLYLTQQYTCWFNSDQHTLSKHWAPSPDTSLLLICSLKSTPLRSCLCFIQKLSPQSHIEGCYRHYRVKIGLSVPSSWILVLTLPSVRSPWSTSPGSCPCSFQKATKGCYRHYSLYSSQSTPFGPLPLDPLLTLSSLHWDTPLRQLPGSPQVESCFLACLDSLYVMIAFTKILSSTLKINQVQIQTSNKIQFKFLRLFKFG